MLAAALVAGLDLLLIASIARLVGRLASGGGVPIQRLVIIVVTLGWMVALAKALLRSGQYRLGAALWRDLGEQVMARLLDQPYGFHLERDRSELTTRLQVQLTQLAGRIVTPAVLVIGNSTTISILTFGLFWLAGWSAVLLMAVLLLAYGLLALITKGPLRRWQRQKMDAEVASHALVNDALGNIRTVLLGHSQDRVLSGYRSLSRMIELANARSDALPEMPRLLIEPLGLTILLLLLLLPSIRSSGMQSLPWLALITVAMLRLAQPLQELWRAVNQMQASVPAMEACLGLLDLPSASKGFSQLPPVSLPGRQLGLAGVWFRYPTSSDWILRGLDLRLNAGERAALVGPTGSGKTTTASLLLGLLQPQRGSLESDGHPLRGDQLPAWQVQCGEVGQPVRLLRGSVAENVTFWRDGITRKQIWEALDMAQLADVVSGLPQGLATMIGDDGVQLSGGQRQRLALARAVLLKPRLLVLDEATNAMDQATESAVLHTLQALGPDTTILVIAHRLATMRHCERLFLMEAGVITAMGSFPQLEQESAAFRALIASPS
jgi:ATP-binding cassette subfamily B protein